MINITLLTSNLAPFSSYRATLVKLSLLTAAPLFIALVRVNHKIYDYEIWHKEIRHHMYETQFFRYLMTYTNLNILLSQCRQQRLYFLLYGIIIVFKVIATITLMMLSYLHENENKRVYSNEQTFVWLVSALDDAIYKGSWHGYNVIEILEVGSNFSSIDEYS